MTDFERFWALYPKRRARKDALKAWTQLNPSPATVEEILSDVAWKARQQDWKRDGGMYIPYPASYIRGERWTDEDPRTIADITEWECPHATHCGSRWTCQRLRDIDAAKKQL